MDVLVRLSIAVGLSKNLWNTETITVHLDKFTCVCVI
jgi:hypothetical protein